VAGQQVAVFALVASPGPAPWVDALLHQGDQIGRQLLFWRGSVVGLAPLRGLVVVVIGCVVLVVLVLL
jgi:hypothetical protein